MSTLNFGICIVYWIDYAFSSHHASYAWRVPVILQCLPIIAMLAILTVIPETPRWLAAHDKDDDCLEVLARIKGVSVDDPDVRLLHASIIHTVAYEKSIGSGAWRTLLADDGIRSRRRLLLACGIQSFQQLGGINAIICENSSLVLGYSAPPLTVDQIMPVHFSSGALASPRTCLLLCPAFCRPGSSLRPSSRGSSSIVLGGGLWSVLPCSRNWFTLTASP